MTNNQSHPSLPIELWLSNAIEVVAEIADGERQQAAWRSGAPPTIFDSADEMMCRLFDDIKIVLFLEECADVLGEACVKNGQRLVDLLDNFQWPMSGQFINDERLVHERTWDEVRVAASQFLDCLKATMRKLS